MDTSRVAALEVHGETLEKIEEMAAEAFDTYFGKDKWAWLEVRAETGARTAGSFSPVYWRAECSAAKVD